VQSDPIREAVFRAAACGLEICSSCSHYAVKLPNAPTDNNDNNNSHISYLDVHGGLSYGLLAGIVPVYLGSKTSCSALMPSNHSVIYLQDFQYNMEQVANYLLTIGKDKNKYDAYRLWRDDFDIQQQSSLLTISWPCRICEWAAKKKLVQ
jgi:hypothetical protein